MGGMGGGGPHTYEKGNALFCVKSVRWANEGRMGRSLQAALLNGTKTEGDNDTERHQPSGLCQNNTEAELHRKPGGMARLRRDSSAK